MSTCTNCHGPRWIHHIHGEYLCCRCMDEVAKRLADIIKTHLEHSADGVLLATHQGPLYCPECGGKVEQQYDLCYCWDCGNHDDFGQVPLPLSYSSVLAHHTGE